MGLPALGLGQPGRILTASAIYTPFDGSSVRVGPDAYQEALGQPCAREMDFTGQPLKGLVYVASEGFESDQSLRDWVDRGTRYALSLPPK